MLLLFNYYSDPDLVVNLAEVAPWEDAVGEAYKHQGKAEKRGWCTEVFPVQ